MCDDGFMSSKTTYNDWLDAKLVLEKCKKGCCLWTELENFVAEGRKRVTTEMINIDNFKGYWDTIWFTSPGAVRMQRKVHM